MLEPGEWLPWKPVLEVAPLLCAAVRSAAGIVQKLGGHVSVVAMALGAISVESYGTISSS